METAWTGANCEHTIQKACKTTCSPNRERGGEYKTKINETKDTGALDSAVRGKISLQCNYSIYTVQIW